MEEKQGDTIDPFPFECGSYQTEDPETKIDPFEMRTVMAFGVTYKELYVYVGVGLNKRGK